MKDWPGKCPYCGGTTGLYMKTKADVTQWVLWNGEIEDTEIGIVTLRKRAECIDCGRIVTIPGTAKE